MKLAIIPITKSLSLNIEDIIGKLEIYQDFAELLVAMSAANLSIELETIIEQKKGEKFIKIASFKFTPINQNN